MYYNFKKLNSKVLTFDPIKDCNKIIFNHYIMRKENKNRITGELENGQFKISVRTVMKDLNLSKGKSERLIKEFERLGIIKLISKGNNNNKYSIFEYISGKKVGTVDETLNETANGTVDFNYKDDYENSNMNGFNEKLEKDNLKDFGTVNNTLDGTVNENSKINNINIYLNINNNICNNVIEYLNKVTKKNFRKDTVKTRKLINTRLKEGFVEEDFYRVIDTKSSQWLDNDMEKYLRPETLFSNKFEGYLNESPKQVERIEPTGSWEVEFEF